MDTPHEVQVALVADEEIPACFQLVSKSFGSDAPFVSIYFPAHNTPAGQARGSKRLLEWKTSSPESTFLKAVIPPKGDSQERIVGFAVWSHLKEAPPSDLSKAENVVEIWSDERDREYMMRLWRQYVIPRSKAIEEAKGRGVHVLELLAVHPDYQRLGAGTALVRWGTKVADKAQIKSVVEGTPVARRLYEKCGMRATIEEMRFDVGEGFDDRKKPTLIFLTRDPA